MRDMELGVIIKPCGITAVGRLMAITLMSAAMRAAVVVASVMVVEGSGGIVPAAFTGMGSCAGASPNITTIRVDPLRQPIAGSVAILVSAYSHLLTRLLLQRPTSRLSRL